MTLDDIDYFEEALSDVYEALLSFNMRNAQAIHEALGISLILHLSLMKVSYRD